jgi:hypothetical protein
MDKAVFSKKNFGSYSRSIMFVNFEAAMKIDAR